MVNKMYKATTDKTERKGSKHNQVIMSIIGKFIHSIKKVVTVTVT